MRLRAAAGAAIGEAIGSAIGAAGALDDFSELMTAARESLMDAADG